MTYEFRQAVREINEESSIVTLYIDHKCWTKKLNIVFALQLEIVTNNYTGFPGTTSHRKSHAKSEENINNRL